MLLLFLLFLCLFLRLGTILLQVTLLAASPARALAWLCFCLSVSLLLLLLPLLVLVGRIVLWLVWLSLVFGSTAGGIGIDCWWRSQKTNTQKRGLFEELLPDPVIRIADLLKVRELDMSGIFEACLNRWAFFAEAAICSSSYLQERWMSACEEV